MNKKLKIIEKKSFHLEMSIIARSAVKNKKTSLHHVHL